MRNLTVFILNALPQRMTHTCGFSIYGLTKAKKDTHYTKSGLFTIASTAI
jgi:hypothetical protein